MDIEEDAQHHHDIYAVPPQAVCDVFKQYTRTPDSNVDSDESIVDFQRGLTAAQKRVIQPAYTISKDSIQKACHLFSDMGNNHSATTVDDARACTVYEHADFPGMRIFPSLLPPSAQLALISRLMHRDLGNPLHKTNFHDHYEMPKPKPDINKSAEHHSNAATTDNASADQTAHSFFAYTDRHPLNPKVVGSSHPPMNMAQFLQRRLRWLTLGTQYDWPTRQYPARDAVVSPFPADIRALVGALFPRVRAESGVVLIYGPRDYMPVHRDVSELCERELCSFSLGCDGLFVLALPEIESGGVAARLTNGNGRNGDVHRVDTNGETIPETSTIGEALPNGKQATDDTNGRAPSPSRTDDCSSLSMKIVTIRVRSGDMIQLDGPSRWAWHAMPKVMAGTCPPWLSQWPVEDRRHDHPNYRLWKGYMQRKRVNISCRQVWD